jgi:hypothetical protein
MAGSALLLEDAGAGFCVLRLRHRRHGQHQSCCHNPLQHLLSFPVVSAITRLQPDVQSSLVRDDCANFFLN